MATKGLPICEPQGYPWQVIVTDATGASGSPYTPSGNTSRINVEGYSRVTFRAKYLTAETLTTDPVCKVWGLREGTTKWESLYDTNATASLTLTLADAATDNNDATYKYTHNVYPYDTRGCSWVTVTVVTAAVSSAAGAVVIEASVF